MLLIQCGNCPSNADCNSCLELIEGGTLRKKVFPPVRLTLHNKENEEYAGRLCGISRVGMLIETNAPHDEYLIDIKGELKAHLSPIFHKGIKNLIAFDIMRVSRKDESDDKLTKDEYEFLYTNKKELINRLTENLQDDIKNKVREELQNELLKSELLDQLVVGATFKYEKGRLKQLSGQGFTLLKEQDMIDLMEAAIKANEPKRELLIDTDNERYFDLHSIPLGHQTGGFLTLDVTDVVNKEKALLQEQWDNYKEVIYSITKGKIELMKSQELNEILQDYDKKGEFDISSIKILAQMRENAKKELIHENIPESKHNKILLAIQEAATNTLKHAKAGMMETFSSEEELLFLVSDNGSGIQLKDLPKSTLIEGFSTTSTLGQGFHLMSRFSDKLYLKSDRYGTSIGLVFKKSI